MLLLIRPKARTSPPKLMRITLLMHLGFLVGALMKAFGTEIGGFALAAIGVVVAAFIYSKGDVAAALALVKTYAYVAGLFLIAALKFFSIFVRSRKEYQSSD